MFDNNSSSPRRGSFRPDGNPDEQTGARRPRQRFVRTEAHVEKVEPRPKFDPNQSYGSYAHEEERTEYRAPRKINYAANNETQDVHPHYHAPSGEGPYPHTPRPKKKKQNPNLYSKNKQREFIRSYEDPNVPIRLNKYLANAGICSRREADDFIQAGVIKVNGEVVDNLGAKVLITDKVMFHDQPVHREQKVYLLLNKPKNTVTTTDDPEGRKTVMEIVRSACAERIYPVGRLDRNTTGVLLMTNDGDLAAKLTHPKFGKRKVYSVFIDRDLEEADEAILRQGVMIDDEKVVPDDLAFTREGSRQHLGIEIHSGQNRVVRRMFEQIGYRVINLDRTSFAGITKKNVKRGTWRFLTAKEVNMLKMGAFE